MDSQQQQRINRAAQEFSGALVAAYKTTTESTAMAQELGAHQIEYFFDTVINNLRTQAEGASQITHQLVTQQQLAREATQNLTRMSTDNYMDFLDSMFSFYQGGSSRFQRRIEEAEARAVEAERRAEEAESSRSEGERQTEDARRIAGEAQRRVKEAEKDVRAARRRAEAAERELAEARKQTEQAEERAEAAEIRAAEAERSGSEAESQGGNEEGDTEASTVDRPLSRWVRTSGRPRVRGRNTRSRGRSSGRR